MASSRRRGRCSLFHSLGFFRILLGFLFTLSLHLCGLVILGGGGSSLSSFGGLLDVIFPLSDSLLFHRSGGNSVCGDAIHGFGGRIDASIDLVGHDSLVVNELEGFGTGHLEDGLVVRALVLDVLSVPDEGIFSFLLSSPTEGQEWEVNALQGILTFSDCIHGLEVLSRKVSREPEIVSPRLLLGADVTEETSNSGVMANLRIVWVELEVHDLVLDNVSDDRVDDHVSQESKGDLTGILVIEAISFVVVRVGLLSFFPHAVVVFLGVLIHLSTTLSHVVLLLTLCWLFGFLFFFWGESRLLLEVADGVFQVGDGSTGLVSVANNSFLRVSTRSMLLLESGKDLLQACHHALVGISGKLNVFGGITIDGA